MLEWENWRSTTLLLFTRPINIAFSTRAVQINTWKELGMTRLLVQHLLYHSKGEMLRWEQSKGHSKGTRAYKVFSLNPLYRLKEDYQNTCLTNPKEWTTLQSSSEKSWTLPSLSHDGVYFCAVDLPLITLLVWGMAFRLQTQPFPTVCYSHLLTKGHSKGTRAWKKIIQSL